MTNPEKLALLRKQPWERIVLELNVYALRKARAKFWPTGSGSQGPERTLMSGWSVPDLAHESIGRVFDGRRNWEPEKSPDIVEYLKGVVDSLLSSLVESSDNRNVREPPRGGLADSDDGGTGVPMVFGAESPDQAANSPSATAACNDALTAVLDKLEGEEDLQLLVLAIADGYTTRQEIAEQLGVSPSDVTNLRKRLNRKIYRTPIGDIKTRGVGE